MLRLGIATVAIAAILACPPPATAADQLDLAAAVRSGDSSEVRRLLAKGVDPNTPYGPDSCSALHLAATSDHHSPEVIELLLAHGADINKRSRTGRAPLQYAILSDNRSVARLLLAKGANPE